MSKIHSSYVFLVSGGYLQYAHILPVRQEVFLTDGNGLKLSLIWERGYLKLALKMNREAPKLKFYFQEHTVSTIALCSRSSCKLRVYSCCAQVKFNILATSLVYTYNIWQVYGQALSLSKYVASSQPLLDFILHLEVAWE